MRELLLIKSHVAGYTRKDGTYVAPHEDRRVKRVEGRPAQVTPAQGIEEKYAREYPDIPVLAIQQIIKMPMPDNEPYVLRHDSSSDKSFKVTDSGDFGGIFAGPYGGMGGQYRHAVILDPESIAEHGDISDEAMDHVVDTYAEDDASDDDKELLKELLEEERFFNDLDEDEAEAITGRFFGIPSDLGEASWKLQAMRGEAAKKDGFSAVEMHDETGVSTLVLPGATTVHIGQASMADIESLIDDEWNRRKSLRKSEYGPRFLLLKSYVKAHTRKTKAGKTVQIAAHYDARTKKGAEHAPAHGHDVSHLSSGGQKKFGQMHAEQHFMHHYHGHALRERIKSHEAKLSELDKATAEHRQAGRHKDAAKSSTKALKLNSDLHRYRRELSDVDAHVKGLGDMLNQHVKGAGDVGASSADHHDRYAGKVGRRWKGEKPEREPVMFGDLDLSKPEAYADEGVAAAARSVVKKDFLKIGAGKMGRGEFKRKVLAGDFPDAVMAVLTKKQAEKSVVAGAISAAKSHAEELGVTVSPHEDSGGISVSGPYNDDIHSRVKRAGGAWDGSKKGWVIGKDSAGKLPSALKNAAKAAAKKKGGTVAIHAATKTTDEKKDSVPVSSGSYGKISIAHIGFNASSGYKVSFPYNPLLVSKIKDISGRRYNPDDKSWTIPSSQAGKLASIASEEKARNPYYSEKDETAKRKERQASSSVEMPRQRRVMFPQYSKPAIGDIQYVNGKASVVTGYGKVFKISEDDPSIHGSHLLGHEGEMALYAYYRDATEEEKAAHGMSDK